MLLILGVVFAKSRGKRKSWPSSTTTWAVWRSRAKIAWRSPWIRSPTPAACARRTWAAIPDDILVEESGTHRALQETQDIPLAPTVRTDETISSETAINLDQGDPLAEADFHMAYGLYDQAADLVRIAIQREPRSPRPEAQAPRSVLRLGQQGAVPAPRRASCPTRARQSRPGEWEKIVIMGKQIAPEDPMFADGAGGGGAVGVDLNLDAGGSGRVDFDPFDVSARMDVTGGGNADAVDLDLGSALRDPDATGEGLALPGS